MRKKILIITIAVLLGMASFPLVIKPVYGRTVVQLWEMLGAFTGPRSGTAQDDNIKASLDLAHTDLDSGLTLHNTAIGLHNTSLALQKGNSTVWYVDSGATGTGAGTSWTNATTTISAAIALVSAEDIILVNRGHNESLTTADGVDADVASISIIGIGNGANKPILDYDAAAAEFVIGAANVLVENIRFRVSSNAVTAAIDVEDAGDSFTIRNCEFGYAETATDEFAIAININDNVDYGLIENCYFNAGGLSAAHAIYVVSSTEGITIRNCTIIGDYSTACIGGGDGDYCHNIIVRDNIIFNGYMEGDGGIGSVAAISFANNTAGLIIGNDIVADVASALLQVVADDMVLIDNFRAAADGDEFGGQIETAATSITASPSK